MTTIPGYLTTTEARERLGKPGDPISRQFVSKLARREGWRSLDVGRSKLWLEADISEFEAARARTAAARAEGWRGVGLIRNETPLAPRHQPASREPCPAGAHPERSDHHPEGHR